MSINDFSDKYKVSAGAIYVGKHNGSLSSNAFKAQYNSLFVDEEYFIRRERFKRKVWLESHDMFYFLTKHLSILEVASMLSEFSGKKSNWSSWMNGPLFQIDDTSIINCKVNSKAWEFYRIARWIIRRLFVKARVPVSKRDITILLER